VQREGEVIHVVAERLEDLSGLLRSVGDREEALKLRSGRADEARHGVGIDPRTLPSPLGGNGPRVIDIPDLRPGSGIKISTRDFR
jgi:error-prone DNA polymerase